MAQAALLVGDSESDADLLYKTRFLAGDTFIYAESDRHRMLVVSPMEQGRARKESSVQDVRNFDEFGYRQLLEETKDRPKSFTTVLARIAGEVGADTLAVQHTFPVLYADALRSRGLSLDIRTDLFTAQRRHKSHEEIAAIEEAQRATERAMDRAAVMISGSEVRGNALLLDGIPLTSERVRSEIELSLMRDGMDVSLQPIVAGGPGAADPHWIGTGPLRPGEAIVIDIFPRSKRTRYFADMTRTFVKGEPGETLRAMYAATERALEAALDVIRPGASGRAVNEAAKQVLKAAGFNGETGPKLTHGVGHGVGLDIHEAPSMGNVDMELLEGDVVTVEPGLYDPDLGAVRIEDLVVVTADGHRNLTDFPRRFEL